jgi:AmmeMemoRadiSam system protein A
MSNNSFLVFAGIAPHPPIMVPEVGGDVIVEVQSSIDGMAEFTRRVIESGAETLITISPHAPLQEDSFVFYKGPTLSGDFAKFRAAGTTFTVQVDDEMLSHLQQTAATSGYKLTSLAETDLDHGTAVPLYFLLRNGWHGKVVALGYSFLPLADHVRFGECLKQAVDIAGRPVALIASGDLSHRLKPGAPAGYTADAYLFDEEVTAAIRANDPAKIEVIDDQLRRRAGECGYRSMLIAIGATKELQRNCELISYEAPFGVGYMVAQISSDASSELPSLARRAVETLVYTGKQLKAPARPVGLLAERAACFVSLKTKAGELRGCIGTVEPVKDTLAEEIIANAIGAATRDPRFDPVNVDDLAELKYSVDILTPAEPTTFEELDPSIYGVIVEDESGDRRGLLLPDIKGVEDARHQVEIAARKAGIPEGAPVKLSRFQVQRFRE